MTFATLIIVQIVTRANRTDKVNLLQKKKKKEVELRGIKRK